MPPFCKKMSKIGLGSSFFKILCPSLHTSDLIISGNLSVFNVANEICLCSHIFFVAYVHTFFLCFIDHFFVTGTCHAAPNN